MAEYIQRYSKRNDGDMRTSNLRETFLAHAGLSKSDLVLAQQIHGNAIGVVSRNDRGQVVPSVDGLVSSDCEVVLGVRVADCVPILLTDPVHHILGVAHAGWRGTMKNIAGNVVAAMKHMGANVADIVVSIGPHIGMCCYDVSRERAGKFRDVFDSGHASEIGGKWYLDLGAINRMSLLQAGILSQHIQAPVVCTSCRHQDYFSFRKDSKDTFGEIMGVVAWK